MRARALPGRVVAKARRDAARRAGTRSGRGTILLYHRVATPGEDPWRLAVAPERFERHMELLARDFRPLPLPELADAARRRRLPRGAVAVTFDDGYVDNLQAAMPVLERTGVPATVFVATAYMGSGRPFWWDELQSLLLGEHELPAEVTLPLDGAPRTWPTATAPEREAAHEEVQDALRRAHPEVVERAVARLRDHAGLDAPAPTGDARPLTLDELGRLTAGGLVGVGAHSRTHPSLSEVDASVVRAEVEGSMADLTEWLGKAPTAFSYPFGHHGGRARRAVRRAGFTLGVGTAHSPVTWLTDRFELPRLWVEDEGPEWLELFLRGLLDA